MPCVITDIGVHAFCDCVNGLQSYSVFKCCFVTERVNVGKKMKGGVFFFCLCTVYGL